MKVSPPLPRPRPIWDGCEASPLIQQMHSPIFIKGKRGYEVKDEKDQILFFFGSELLTHTNNRALQ